MTKYYELIRDYANDTTTLGVIKRGWDGSHFGYSLEDIQRQHGIKIKGKTAIPCGTYHLGVRDSPKYGKVVVIFTQKINETYYLENGGISFEMILAHGGNRPEDTEGCILINKNRDVKNFTANGSLKEQFADEVELLIKDKNDVFIKITTVVP